MDVDLTQMGLSRERVPRHVGIIMDGNGRWASARHLPRLMGHRKGVERVREITELAGKVGIETLTLYAFSEENWRRPEDEVSGLMGLLRTFVKSDREKLIKNGVRFRIIGDRGRLPKDIVETIEALEHDTLGSRGLCLVVALSYGSQGEILRAVRRVAEDAVVGKISPSDISGPLFETYLDTSGLPPVDLVVRTSGECRISNFLLWQIAYAELAFVPEQWPDFGSEGFLRVLREFCSRERRFGMTSAQLGGK